MIVPAKLWLRIRDRRRLLIPSQKHTESEMYAIANNVGKYLTVDTKQLSTPSTPNYATYYIQDPKRAKRVVEASGTTAAPGTDAYVNALRGYVEKHKSVSH